MHSTWCLASKFLMSQNCESIFSVYAQDFPHGQKPPVGRGLLIIEDLRSHSDAPHSVGLLWTSAQPVGETLCWQYIKFIPSPPVGFEPAISTSERPQAYSLDRATTWINFRLGYFYNFLGSVMT